MPKTTGRGKGGKRRTAPRQPTKGPTWDTVDLALRKAGLLMELPVPGPDATDDIPPIKIPGELVSETFIRERR